MVSIREYERVGFPRVTFPSIQSPSSYLSRKINLAAKESRTRRPNYSSRLLSVSLSIRPRSHMVLSGTMKTGYLSGSRVKNRFRELKMNKLMPSLDSSHIPSKGMVKSS